jgi:tol-pal system protein YbgF
MTRGHIALLLCLGALGAAAGGCAVADTGSFVRLQDEVVVLKREVAALKSVPGPSSPAVGDRGEIASLRRAVADLRSDTDAAKAEALAAASRLDEATLRLQRDISQLNGKTDEQARAIAELQARLALLDEARGRLTILEEKMDRLADTPRAPLPPPADRNQSWKSPEEMYDYALGLIRSGQMRNGRGVLDAFAATHPGHRLMPNVYYWRGESFYAEKDFENAILSFQDVVDRYPEGDKAPDAMYKQGLSFLALKDKKNARFLFELIQSRYPKSPSADKARQMLAELK